MRKLLSTDELAKELAGGIDYIRTKQGTVKGLALRLDLNRDAPDVIVVGKGPRIEQKAKLLLDSGSIVPAYVKRKTNSWEYIGDYRATAYRTDRATIGAYRNDRPRDSVAGILFLENVSSVTVEVSGGGFSDPRSRREVEVAAVRCAWEWLEAREYVIEDRQRENCGYDLFAQSINGNLKVEVKGTDSVVPRFFLTRNERRASTDEEWRLLIVTSARTNPQCHLLTITEAERQFSFDALAWECIPIPSTPW